MTYFLRVIKHLVCIHYEFQESIGIYTVGYNGKVKDKAIDFDK